MIRAAILGLSLPAVWAWAERHERIALAEGTRLPTEGLEDAVRVGVAAPERVRVRLAERLPWPGPALLRAAAVRAGLVERDVVGLSLGYGVWIRGDCAGDRMLLVHELVHVAQHERLGGLRPFLRAYLAECLTPPGYPNGKLEQEAWTLSHQVCTPLPLG